MRVQVYIPGTVESYCIDERGDKRVATDELWLETYLCSVLRAYSYADDGSGDTIKKIVGVRRFFSGTSAKGACCQGKLTHTRRMAVRVGP
jgi:hypothetical protein